MVRVGSQKDDCIWKGRFSVKRGHTVFLLSLFIAFGSVSDSLPSVEWDIRSTLKLEASRTSRCCIL
jgi:hypothetical protein